MAREAGMILQVNGLQTIRRFDAGTVTVAIRTILQADQDNARRAKAAAQAKQYTVARLRKPPALDGNAAAWKNVAPLSIGREGRPGRATVKPAYDDAKLYLRFDVQDLSPWRNAGRDFARLFKTGDAVDLQLSARPQVKPHREPAAGDVRLLIAPWQAKPVTVLMVPVDPKASAAAGKDYTSPVGTKHFDRVELLSAARVAIHVEGSRYRVEAAIPLAAIGLLPMPGMKLRGDVGFISSDVQGLSNTARTYWANPNTNLVNDEPSEAWLYPDNPRRGPDHQSGLPGWGRPASFAGETVWRRKVHVCSRWSRLLSARAARIWLPTGGQPGTKMPLWRWFAVQLPTSSVPSGSSV
jgi:hypothetical protein